MIESSISEVQILEAICSGKLVDITDIDSAFNRTADYDDLQKIKKGYQGRHIFAYPPAVAEAPIGCLMHVSWPAYGLGDGPSGYNATIDFRLTTSAFWSRSMHPNLFYQLADPSTPAERRTRIPPSNIMLIPPDATLGNFMDDGILTSLPSGRAALLEDIAARVAPIGRLVSMEIDMPMEYLGCQYTQIPTGLTVDLHPKISRLAEVATHENFGSVRGVLQHIATRCLFYLLPNILALYQVTPAVQEDLHHPLWSTSLKLMQDLLDWLHHSPPPLASCLQCSPGKM
jgi:hypothetical protein